MSNTGETRRLTPGRQVLADETYDVIRTMILNHEIEPGAHIGIDWLTRELDVSQTPVREALARLESDGLVEKIALRGYKTTRLLTPDQFEDLHSFRRLIEPWCAAEAAKQASDDEIQLLQEEVALASGNSDELGHEAWARFREHDARFHGMIAKLAQNGFVTDVFERAHSHWHTDRLFQAALKASREADPGSPESEQFAEYYPPAARKSAISQHQQIAEAISHHEDDLARELMLEHLHDSRQRYREAVKAITESA